MWQKMLHTGSGGSLQTPTKISTSTDVISIGQKATATINTSKNYIIFASTNIAGSTYRQDIYAYINGSIQTIYKGTGCIKNVSVSGSTLSVTNAYNDTYYVSWSVYLLDVA